MLHRGDATADANPLEARGKGGFLTSLGGSPENSSYKGYGLAVMVNILGSCLSGATLITDPMHTKKPQGNDIGHCFIAIDPGLFREREEFTADVTRLCDDLRATNPVDPAQPVTELDRNVPVHQASPSGRVRTSRRTPTRRPALTTTSRADIARAPSTFPLENCW